MALKHHTDDKARYEQQVDNSRQYVLPFIEQTKKINSDTRILEIGCGEGGVLTPFAAKGAAYCLGVDLDQIRIDIANEFLADEIKTGRMEFRNQNVYDDAFLKEFKNSFDLIILKDTIEHVPDQERFIPYLKNLLKADGQIFFGFPPWLMPFGGHQQVAAGKLISKLPWTHLLPRPLYKGLLTMAGEPQRTIIPLMETYDTRITIERFERIIRKSALRVISKQHYLINPIYKYKFGLNPRKQSPIISAIPYLRDFLTTCVYYTVANG